MPAGPRYARVSSSEDDAPPGDGDAAAPQPQPQPQQPPQPAYAPSGQYAPAAGPPAHQAAARVAPFGYGQPRYVQQLPHPQGAPGAAAAAQPPPLPAQAQQLPRQPQQPQQQPRDGVAAPNPPDAAEFHHRLATRVVEPRLGRYFDQGWAAVKANFGRALAAELAAMMMMAAFAALYWAAVRGYTKQEHPWSRPARAGSAGTDGSEWDDEDVDDEVRARQAGVYWVIALGQFLQAVLVTIPLESGAFVALFNGMRGGGRLRFADFFSAFGSKYYFDLLGLSVVMMLLLEVGFFLIVPGLIMQLLFSLAVPVHREQPHLGIRGSLRASSIVVRRYVCNVLGFYVLCVGVIILGLLCLVVGVFVAIPVVYAAKAYMYLHLVGVNGCVLEPGVVFVAAPPAHRRVVAVRPPGAAGPQVHHQPQQVAVPLRELPPSEPYTRAAQYAVPPQPHAQYAQQPHAQYAQQPHAQYAQQPHAQYVQQPQQQYAQHPQQQPNYAPQQNAQQPRYPQQSQYAPATQ